MIKEAKAVDAIPMVITFDPHPANIMHSLNNKKMITKIRHRLSLFDSLGVKICFLIKFSKKFAELSCNDFFNNILIKSLNVDKIIVGFNFGFGKNKQGNIDFLSCECKNSNIDLLVIPPVKFNEELVSSSLIREYLLLGDLKQSSNMLGRTYSIFGKVVKGSCRGRDLGFPTANIEFTNECIPKKGVYAVRVRLDNDILKGVANIGIRPTFGDKKLFLEVFIFDFDKNIYDKEIEVFFIDKIRNEQIFDSTSVLKSQIFKDCNRAREILL